MLPLMYGLAYSMIRLYILSGSHKGSQSIEENHSSKQLPDYLGGQDNNDNIGYLEFCTQN